MENKPFNKTSVQQFINKRIKESATKGNVSFAQNMADLGKVTLEYNLAKENQKDNVKTPQNIMTNILSNLFGKNTKDKTNEQSNERY